ncbi:PhzF family phenazine biosynthesis protein [Actinomadura verrucosospora]|uniref:PhzF family phenazine biosynthesis protein n=1 Tax=Actinomadura verrucosospora TaxID=46165 RepID=A0A7D3VYA4_ACTVE|nr:PhzF family phenazine biosynthesis protein [Actinomadura verrucosospora]QKG26675.1 PhzF family phenazine biosynthesis protein [Actinomadura verrucosospora]
MRMLVVDAFADRPFTGNPAGVCLLDGGTDQEADPAWMQRVAAEMKHSETAFVRPVDEPGADFELRWFTPLVEVALCGHATMAAAHALYDTGTVPAGRPIRFRTLKSGVLTVTRDGDGLAMDFPACPPEPAEAPEGLAAALGAEVRWTGRNAQNDLIAELADEDAVRGLAPDMAALGRIDARGVIVTARAAGGGGRHDFVSRFFGARILLGDGEDPVTGSAHCALAPFWAERLGRAELTGYQASERGGHVRTALRGDRVVLSGTAVTVLDGTLRV